MKPNHLVIIPDGNRRWARKRNLIASEGHKQGAKTLENIIKVVFDKKIKYFTFWAMSTDNFKRPQKEISVLVKLIGEGIKAFYKDSFIKNNGFCIRFYGDWRKYYDKKTVLEMEKIQEATKSKTDCIISILIAYDGQAELTAAMKEFGSEKCSNLNFEKIKKHIWTKDLPDVDLIIRTGIKNDPHLSGNMLMFQTGYSQLYFTKTYWPDFNKKELDLALADFEKRQRRLGK